MPPFEIDEALIRRLASLLEETGLGEIEYSGGRSQDPRDRADGHRPCGAVAARTRRAAPAGDAAGCAEAPRGRRRARSSGPWSARSMYRRSRAPRHSCNPATRFDAGDTLVLIEAMKTFNPVRSPRAGRVARVLISDAAPVEYGEVLMILE